MAFVHVPVLLQEVLDVLAPEAGQVFVDCTLGGGGHSEAILAAADCRVIGLDRDPVALEAAGRRLSHFGERFRPVRACFGNLSSALEGLGVGQVDGVLADFGVSSPQLDVPERGFSFRRSGPLDMRMDPDGPVTAADLVNQVDEAELTRIFREYGEERRARAVARKIVAERPWRDTVELAEAVARVVGRGGGKKHPATRVFQALRIAVNDELSEIDRLLPTSVERLRSGGRLAFITFHSLEDRRVKRFLAKESGKGAPRDPYGNPVGTFRLTGVRDLVNPDDPNPRARSARLRTATRLR